MTTYIVASSGGDETTIQAVFDNNDLAPSDIVEVRADTAGGSKTYRETVTWGSNDGGDSNDQVTLRGRDGDTITISGSDVITGWAGPDGNGEYTVAAATEAKVLFRDGTRLEEGTAGSLGAAEWDWSGNVLYLGFDPSGYTIEAGQRNNGLYILNVSYVDVDNLTVEGCNTIGVRLLAFSVAVTNIHLTDVITQNNRTMGMQFLGNNSTDTMSDCSATDCQAITNGTNGFSASRFVSSITCTGCTADGNGWGGNAHGFTTGGNAQEIAADSAEWTQVDASDIWWASINADHKVYQLINNDNGGRYTENPGNFATLGADEWDEDEDNDKLYLNMGEDPNPYQFYYAYAEPSNIQWIACTAKNTVENAGVEGHGFSFDGFAKDSTITRCISGDNDGMGITSNKGAGNTFSYNVSYGNGRNGLGVGTGGANITMYNNVAYNNTVNGFFIPANYPTSVLRNNSSMNNAWWGFQWGASATGITETNNLAYNNTKGEFDGVTKDATSMDSDDPLMTDPANDDFTLKSGSPCIEAGVDVSLTTDLAGNPVRGNPEIGAYEYAIRLQPSKGQMQFSMGLEL